MSSPNSTFNTNNIDFNFSFNLNVGKKCKLCGIEKPLTQYRRQTKNISGFGRKSYCKDCDDEIQRRRYKEKQAKIIPQVREWQSKNPDKIGLYKKKYNNKIKSEKKQQNTNQS